MSPLLTGKINQNWLKNTNVNGLYEPLTSSGILRRIMWFKKPHSLRNLLITHEITFLLLVTATGLLGGLPAYFWQRHSVESVRLNSLIYVNEQIRGDLFRQIQEAIRARLLEEPQALESYGEYSRRIDDHFTRLRKNARTDEENLAIEELQASYRAIQKDMNKIFTDPYMASRQVRMKILDPGFAQSMFGRFEDEYQTMNSLLTREYDELAQVLERWTSYAPVLLPIPLLLAFLLVLYARYILNRDFVKPMSRVISGARTISRGKLEQQLPETGVEEVSQLARTINTMARDLDESHQALVESEKQAALGALVPVVAHNIRNPLASIRATAQVIDNAEDEEDLQESKQAILDTIDRLGRWVNALVSYLHPLKPNYRLVYAHEMVDAALSLLMAKLTEKNIEIKKQGWKERLRLNADPDLMEQALFALIANAIDASPRDAIITISLVPRGQNLEIHIQDQGPGLPFEPKSNNLVPGPSTKRFGTGLGMPIAFKICQRHGWNLNFKTVSGKGTTAIITAPIRIIEE